MSLWSIDLRNLLNLVLAVWRGFKGMTSCRAGVSYHSCCFLFIPICVSVWYVYLWIQKRSRLTGVWGTWVIGLNNIGLNCPYLGGTVPIIDVKILLSHLFITLSPFSMKTFLIYKSGILPCKVVGGAYILYLVSFFKIGIPAFQWLTRVK